jgi:hypothetical protein
MKEEGKIIEALNKKEAREKASRARRKNLLNKMKDEINLFLQYCRENNICVGRFTSNRNTINLSWFRNTSWSWSGWHVMLNTGEIHRGSLHTGQSSIASYACPESIIKKVTYQFLLKRILRSI